MRRLEQVVAGCAASGAAVLVVTPLRHWRGRADRLLELRDGRLLVVRADGLPRESGDAARTPGDAS
jgi:hypothetical protein